MAEVVRVISPTGDVGWSTRELFTTYWSLLGWTIAGEAPVAGGTIQLPAAPDPGEVVRIISPTGELGWSTRTLYNLDWSPLGWTIAGESPGPVSTPEQAPSRLTGEPAVWLEVGPEPPSWTSPGVWAQTGLGPAGNDFALWIDDGVSRQQLQSLGSPEPAIAEAINAHIQNMTPHPVYDDLPSLALLFENGLI